MLYFIAKLVSMVFVILLLGGFRVIANDFIWTKNV